MNDTLLIVDDEPNVLKSLKRLLLDTDYKILMAESGEEGLKLFEDNEIHVVISDYRMPGMNGVEFLRLVKEKSPDTIRLILSGYADAVAIVEAINEGQVYRFITKPWNDQELLTTVINTFDHYALQKENEKLYGELQGRNKELQEMTVLLEEKVQQRTRDLEIKNRALILAHNILNYLPVGVIGIDSQYAIVYMNESLQRFLEEPVLGLGQDARVIFDGNMLSIIERVLKSQKPCSKKLGYRNNVIAIWSPLPRHEGVIGIFIQENTEKLYSLNEPENTKAGISNVD
jgi:YesN/AraC family two-component response regulator